MIAPDHSDGPHADPGGTSDSSAMYAKAYVPPITAVSEADDRPGRRALHAIQASAARPVSTGTGSRYSRPLVINTKIPFSVKTKVSEPGRGLNALLSSNPVPARIADWASSAAIPPVNPSGRARFQTRPDRSPTANPANRYSVSSDQDAVTSVCPARA